MTTATATNLIWRASTTTEHYNWVKKISDALTAIGLVKTADTGQLPLTGTTLAIPSSPDETFKMSGYEIRKLESAGKPTLYIRFEYGVRRYTPMSTAATNVVPALRITVGTETNGAGALGGVAITPMASAFGFYATSALPLAPQRPFFFSSDGANYLTMLIDPALVGSGGNQSVSWVPLALVVERSIDPATGAYDSDGYIAISQTAESYAGESNYMRWVANLLAGSAAVSNNVPVQGDPMWNTSGYAGATTVFPVTVMLPKPKGPSKSLVYLFTDDSIPGISFSTTMYGETRTFITATRRTNLNSAPAGTQYYPAFRFD